MLSIDLNCDLGEAVGPDDLEIEAQLLALVSSVNIACGGHAGDESSMRRTVALCLKHGVALGAHPSYPDREGFGRRRMDCAPQEVADFVRQQLDALQNIVRAAGGELQHVKPHGALYNAATTEPELAETIVRAVREYDSRLWLYGPPASALLTAGAACGLRVAAEGFADRVYLADGSLMPRSEPGAVIADPSQTAAQALQLIRRGTVTAATGEEIPHPVQTLCLHGDTPNALAIAQAIRAMLNQAGIIVRTL